MEKMQPEVYSVNNGIVAFSKPTDWRKVSRFERSADPYAIDPLSSPACKILMVDRPLGLSTSESFNLRVVSDSLLPDDFDFENFCLPVDVSGIWVKPIIADFEVLLDQVSDDELDYLRASI